MLTDRKVLTAEMETIFQLYCSSEDRLKRPWQDTTATDEENERAKKAYEAVLTVTAISSSKASTEYMDFAKGVKALSKAKFNYTYEGPVNNFVANFHDAVSKSPSSLSSAFDDEFSPFLQVLLYATALREAIDDCGLDDECVLKAKSNGTLIVEKMWDRSIQGENNLLSIKRES